MKLVVLESPYAGDVEANTEYARRCLFHSLMQGEAPVAGHMLYTQPGVLDDGYAPDRALGIAAHMAWIKRADKLVVYRDNGVTEGMTKAVQYAMRTGVPIEYREIDERPFTEGVGDAFRKASERMLVRTDDD